MLVTLAFVVGLMILAMLLLFAPIQIGIFVVPRVTDWFLIRSRLVQSANLLPVPSFADFLHPLTVISFVTSLLAWLVVLWMAFA